MAVITKEKQMKVTFFETTTLLFDDGTDQILFDCHFTRPSLAKYVTNGSEPTDTALADFLMKLYDISRLKAIFVSHSHHDHVMDVPYVANKTGAEGVFGVLKQDYGYERLHRRGIEKTELELTLVIIGFNLNKYHNKLNRPGQSPA